MDDFRYLHDSFKSVLKPERKSSGDINEIPNIIIVEDDLVFGKAIQRYLEKKLGLLPHLFSSPAKCLDSIEGIIGSKPGETGKPFCLITDISFDDSKSDGLMLIDLLKEKNFEFSSIVMTGFASIETAINATKKGVFHYLTKPFDLENLSNLVFESLTKKLGVCPQLLKGIINKEQAPVKAINGVFTSEFKIEEPTEDDMFCGMIGRSKAMKDVFERIEKISASDSTVLVNGPSGTGKELVSQAIHTLSKRNRERMVSVNCGAIPNELLESELFGHMKGSFTGAISDRKGRFELADKGTIFLDEIGDMPLLLQVKLLRVLQSRQIEPVGSNACLDIDTRIITATHRDLEKAVKEGNFREDLFYRLNVIPIKIPSLSERREDIPLLISFFLKRFVSADGRNNVEFDEEALEMLISYDWPGNVRELENLIERLVILKGGNKITIDDLPAKFTLNRPSEQKIENQIDLPEVGMDLKKILSEIEDSLILQALEKTGGNKNQASKLLQMNRTTLIEKMKKKGLLTL